MVAELPEQPSVRLHRELQLHGVVKTSISLKYPEDGIHNATGNSLRPTVCIQLFFTIYRLIFLLLIGSVKLDQIFRGAPNSPVSLLNKASICSTGLTPKVSENLSYTTFTIDKDNSLTLTPVPKPPLNTLSYYDEPKFHKVEFTPRSTPGLDRMSDTHRTESVADETPNVTDPVARTEAEKPKIPLQIKEDRPNKCNDYDVFVPKAHRTFEEYLPNVNAYTDPVRSESRCSLKSPSSFKPTDKLEKKPETVVQERSLPVRTLIDTFEHNNRPVMRYLQLEESIPMSAELKRLHDDPPPPPLAVDDEPADGYGPQSPDRENGYYTCDTMVETRSFVYGTQEQRDGGEPERCVDESFEYAYKQECADGSEYADKSVPTDRSEYGDRSDEIRSLHFDAGNDAKFQTIRQLATPDSLESSMLFAQKQSAGDSYQHEYGNHGHNTGHRAPGKTNAIPLSYFCTFVKSPLETISECPTHTVHVSPELRTVFCV